MSDLVQMTCQKCDFWLQMSHSCPPDNLSNILSCSAHVSVVSGKIFDAAQKGISITYELSLERINNSLKFNTLGIMSEKKRKEKKNFHKTLTLLQ